MAGAVAVRNSRAAAVCRTFASESQAPDTASLARAAGRDGQEKQILLESGRLLIDLWILQRDFSKAEANKACTQTSTDSRNADSNADY